VGVGVAAGLLLWLWLLGSVLFYAMDLMPWFAISVMLFYGCCAVDVVVGRSDGIDVGRRGSDVEQLQGTR
jgi:hypothetical protein